MLNALITQLTLTLTSESMDQLNMLQRIYKQATGRGISHSSIIAACIDHQLKTLTGDDGDRFTITAHNTTHNTTQQETQQ